MAAHRLFIKNGNFVARDEQKQEAFVCSPRACAPLRKAEMRM